VLRQAALEGLKGEIDDMVTTVTKVIRQAKARVFGGDTHVGGKILSIFETFRVHEAENQIVISFEVYDQKPSDSDLLIPSIQAHQWLMGRTPDLVAADAGFYSAANVAKAEEMGVRRVSVPNRSTKSQARRQLQKKRWVGLGTVVS
ncbi:MAG: transposase, partial [Acidobacteriia bacterium]|nr:transposase [Terriglobia bacterium]